MEGETRVLKDRIEIAAFKRRVGDADERIRGDENEQLECGSDPGLHGERVGLERRRQVAAETCDQRAKERKDRYPQHHRAFVVAPDAGEPVDQRHRRVGILIDIENRKIGNHVALGKRQESDRHKRELRQRRRSGETHQQRIIGARADDRHDALDQRQPQRQHQGVMAEFGDHFSAPVTGKVARCAYSSFQCPDFFKASTTSFGM